MIALGLRIAQLLLGATVVVLSWGVVAPLFARSVPEVDFPPVPAAQRDVAAFNRYAVIGTRNLFETPEGAPVPAPIEESMPESQLQFRVVGAVAGPDGNSVALIEDTQKKVKTYAVGTPLAGGAIVERIERRRVVLNNRGRRESLDMRDPETPASLALLQSGKESYARVIPVPPRPPAYVAVASPELVSRVDRQVAPVAESPGPLPRTRRRGAAERELPSEGQRLRRTLQGGSTSRSAFAAFAGPVPASNTAFEAVAGQPLLVELRRQVPLRAGERIREVNGVPVEAADRLPELLRSLTRRSPSRVRIAVDSGLEREIEVTLP